MKPIAAIVAVAVFSFGAAAASAKTVTVPQKDNDRVVAGVSGATPGKDKASSSDARDQPRSGKKKAKTSRIPTPPPLHDPN